MSQLERTFVCVKTPSRRNIPVETFRRAFAETIISDKPSQPLVRRLPLPLVVSSQSGNLVPVITWANRPTSKVDSRRATKTLSARELQLSVVEVLLRDGLVHPTLGRLHHRAVAVAVDAKGPVMLGARLDEEDARTGSAVG